MAKKKKNKKQVKKPKLCLGCKSKNWKAFVEVSGYWCLDCGAAWEEEDWRSDE